MNEFDLIGKYALKTERLVRKLTPLNNKAYRVMFSFLELMWKLRIKL